MKTKFSWFFAVGTVGLVGCIFNRQINTETAYQQIKIWDAQCSGDWLKVQFKNGQARDKIAACSVTKTYLEPCCPTDGHYGRRCEKPEHWKFADMSKIERYGADSYLGRCFLNTVH